MEIRMALLFSLVSICSAHEIMKRRTGDQAPPGQCALFNRGGVSGLHYYVCCNNCRSSDTSCDGRTYHRASSESYCGTCGRDNSKGNGKKISVFSCGGCSGQNSIYTKCSNMINNIPGFCWVFTRCFEKKCKKYPSQPMAIIDTCFDGICQPSETVENCPIDCCASKNAKCARNGKCPPECCDSPTCCNRSSSLAKNTYGFLLLLIIINRMKTVA